jgi:hypothetical protein
LALCLVSGDWAWADDPATPRFDEEPIYGEELMSAEERERVRVQLQEARDGGERRRIRGRHRRAMDERARERGIGLPVFGERYLTEQERVGFREALRNAKGDRQRIDLRKRRTTLINERLEADRKTWQASGKSRPGRTGSSPASGAQDRTGAPLE